MIGFFALAALPCAAQHIRDYRPSLPVAFMPNEDLADAGDLFLVRTGEISARFARKQVVLAVKHQQDESATERRWTRIRVGFSGALPGVVVEGGRPLPGKANFFLGSDPSRWRTDVPLYSGIRYRGLYPGIDMTYTGEGPRLKSEFLVAPDADPAAIRLRFGDLASPLWIDGKDGALVIPTAQGELREQRPYVYQEIDGRRLEIEARFVLLAPDEVGFELGPYDRSRALTIDPVLSYATYLGGSAGDVATAIAVDASRSAYVTGYTDALDFPVSSAVQTANRGGVDVIVAKLAPDGGSLVYATYLGGSGDDRGFGIAVDSSGSAVVSGWTQSSNFPLAAASQPGFGGTRDAFVARLSAGGNALVYSTYFGGAGTENATAVALDSQGSAYVTGDTNSTNLPVLGALRTTLAGGWDAFVLKLNSSGARVYSTYLGGTGDDRGNGIAVDAAGAAYIAGGTFSVNFPTAGALQAANRGGQDAFVVKLTPAGNALAYGTYLGGDAGTTSFPESALGIAVDTQGCAYIAGVTGSVNFPMLNPFQSARAGGAVDAFVAKLSASGSALVYSTYLGGTSTEYATSIAVDGSGIAHVAGYTSSTDFPTTGGIQPNRAGSTDAWVVKLGAAGNSLTFGTYLGGSAADGAFGVAVDSTGSIYLAGQTASQDFPLAGAVQTYQLGSYSAFVARITFTNFPAIVALAPASGSGLTQTFVLDVSDADGQSDIGWAGLLVNSSAAARDGCSVAYTADGNALWLYGDDGSTAAGPLDLGTTTEASNSQCTIHVSGSSASGSGNNLSVRFALTFAASFTGAKNVYAQVIDRSGQATGWQAKGTWTPAAPSPPTVGPVSPASGSGTSQVFAFQFLDSNGAGDIAWAEVLYQSSLEFKSACAVRYRAASNSIWLLADDGGTALGPYPLGSATVASNSQCAVNLAGSSRTLAGNTLTLSLAVTFGAAFTGPRQIYAQALDRAGQASGWQTLGSWTATSNLPPRADSVAPSSGSGLVQAFTFQFSDPNGSANLAWTEVLIQNALDGKRACLVSVQASTQSLWLAGDDGGALAGPFVLGSATTPANSQCSINLAASSRAVSGNNLTLLLAVSFSGTFTGAKSIFGRATDASGQTSGWQTLGSWTVASNTAPAADSVTPASGSGTAQTLVFQFSDANGAADIAWVEVLVSAALDAKRACLFFYRADTNAIWLQGDDGGAAIGPQTLGAAAGLANSQCSLTVASASRNLSGSGLTLTLPLTLAASFTGARSIYAQASDRSGASSGWRLVGSWNPGGNAAPAAESVTPSSGSGAGQTFAVRLSDPNGAEDIAWAQVLVDATVSGKSACLIYLIPESGTLWLQADDGGTALGPFMLGASGTAANSQCSLNLLASSKSVAGTALTAGFSLQFTGGFRGAKNIYARVSDRAGLASGWQTLGSWTVP